MANVRYPTEVPSDMTIPIPILSFHP